MRFEPQNLTLIPNPVYGFDKPRIHVADLLDIPLHKYLPWAQFTLENVPIKYYPLITWYYFINNREIPLFDEACANIILHCWYSKRRFREIIQILSSYSKTMLSKMSLCLGGVSLEILLRDEEIYRYLGLCNKIYLSYDYRDKHFPETYSTLKNSGIIKRRRPCLSPFYNILIDSRNNVFPCEYYPTPITKYTGLSNLNDDKKYLLFLAAQLKQDFTICPFCIGCCYWLDEWLAEEKKTISTLNGDLEIIYECHGCSISSKRKRQ